MRVRLYIASALLGATALLHIFGGGPTVHQPLLNDATSAELGLYISVLWHFVTLVLILGAGALGVAAWRPDWSPLAVVTGLICLGAGALFLWYGITRLGDVMIAGQWMIFFAIGALALWPKRRV